MSGLSFHLVEEKLLDLDSKFAIQVAEDILKFHAIATNGTYLRRILNHSILTKMYSLEFEKVLLVDVSDDKLQQLITGGLIDFYDSDYRDYINPKRYDHLHHRGPQVLRMEHLSAGFSVWLVSVAAAMISFVIEWIFRLKEFLDFTFILKGFYQMKQQEMRKNKKAIIERNSLKNSLESTSQNFKIDKEKRQENFK